MADKTAEIEVCPVCGEAVRAGALFCYGCGASITADSKNEAASGGEKKVDELSGDGNNSTELKTDETVSASRLEEISVPFKKPIVKTASEVSGKREKRIIVQEETQLKTAASLRQKAKPPEKKSIEVVWEAADNSPNVWFLIVSAILVLFAVGALLAMLYIK